MPRLLSSFALALVVAASLGLSGCGFTAAAEEKAAAQAGGVDQLAMPGVNAAAITEEPIAEARSQELSKAAEVEYKTYEASATDELPKRKLVVPMVDGTIHGIVKSYDHQGRLMCTNTFQHGKPDGKIVVYYPSGNVAGTAFEDENGTYGLGRNYFDGGGVAVEEPHANGRVHGQVVHYYRNGQKFFEGLVVNGYEDGRWTYYLPNGRVWCVEDWVAGEAIAERVVNSPSEQQEAAIKKRFALPRTIKEIWE